MLFLLSYGPAHYYTDSFPLLFTEVPAPPQNVLSGDIFANSATITWETPESDGGSPITGYVIERATNNSGKWIRVTRDAVKELSHHFDSLLEGTVYEFRVIALNKKGESRPSEPCAPFTAKNPYGKFFDAKFKMISSAHLINSHSFGP